MGAGVSTNPPDDNAYRLAAVVCAARSPLNQVAMFLVLDPRVAVHSETARCHHHLSQGGPVDLRPVGSAPRPNPKSGTSFSPTINREEQW